MTTHQIIIALVILVLLSGCSKDQMTTETEEQKNGGVEVTPFATVEDAIAFVDAYDGKADDFRLPISESLIDPVGVSMAIITDKVLAKDFLPDGFEQRDGYRLYKYKSAE